MNYHIWTIGCQYNEWDGARLNFLMHKLGFSESKAEDANVIIILACSVRQTAVDRILGRVKNWRVKAEQKNRRTEEPNNKIENKNNSKQSSKKLPLILASGCVLDFDKDKFAKKGIEFFKSGDFEKLFELLSSKIIISPPKNYNLSPKTCYIPIMSGCNNFCSYCAVPFTRGREKSRPMEDIITDAKKLIEAGHKEIILLGQNVNSFKIQNTEYRIQQKNDKADFTMLLEKLNDLEGEFSVSFMSNHPKDMTFDIIEAVATLPKIKKQLHLPLQSGSNKILKAMNRPYTAEDYLKLIEHCILKIDNLILSTDIIVGFPGETEEDFQETVNICKIVDYDVAYINKYSPRQETAAYKLGDPIPWAEKKRRWKILDEIVNW